MIRANTQIWIGVAVCVCELALMGFQKVHWGYIEWRIDLAVGPFIALQGYYRLQKQRSTPPQNVRADSKTKDQVFLGTHGCSL